MKNKEYYYRTIIFLVLAAAVVCSVGCGGAESSADGGNSASAGERDRQVLEEASLSTVRSGWFEALFFVDNETRAQAVQWRAVGPFVRSGEGPLQLNARYEFAGLHGQTGGVLLADGDRTMLRYNGQAHRLPRSLSGHASHAASSCQRALEGIELASLVKNISSEPVPEATVIQGDLNLHAVLAALHRLAAPSVCGAHLREAGVSPRGLGALEAQVEKTFKKSEATFTVGKDHVLTGVSLGIWVESPPPDPEEIDGILTVNLSRINEIGEIRESSLARAADADGQKATAVQRARVEGWLGLVNAVVGSLASS